jgi:hypothetical protein
VDKGRLAGAVHADEADDAAHGQRQSAVTQSPVPAVAPASIDANTSSGGMSIDQRFFPHDDDFRGIARASDPPARGDASSDSSCFVD